MQSYLEIYEGHRAKPEFQRRFEELDLIGASHFDAEDEKKGVPQSTKLRSHAFQIHAPWPEGNSVTTVPRTLMLVATNEDGTVRTDAEGYALMEPVTIKEPV